MWNLKNKINEQSKNKLRYREQTGGCQTGGGLGKKGEVQIGGCRIIMGYKVQHKEYSQYCNNYVRCQVGTGNTGRNTL